MELTIGVRLLFSRCHLRGIYAVVRFHNYCMTQHIISKGRCQKPGVCQSKVRDHRANVLFYFPASEIPDKYSCDLNKLAFGVCFV